ncbi:uncharacterized protein LOC125218166 isoform X2 [Salvia hispanica]|uniref:uncharacterized protein LOC125218166 isoform X2 n=1 Tax=Salvia hispanica TaxID=49212 RepID=UPI002009AAC7|nr:uncharacterized protein LOC125218166 isoform X2 [Salvia hispanica]
MAAYGAAISLKNTIQCILQSSRISLAPPSPQVLQPTFDAMASLQRALLKLDETGYSKIRTKVNALDKRIKEVVWEFEDLLESHCTNQILPQLETERDHLSFCVDLQSLRQSVDCFVERVTAMEAEYVIELVNMPEEEGEPISSRIDFGGINSEMVGLKEEFEKVRDYFLMEDDGLGDCYALAGMAGVGKTALAKKVFDDPLIQRHFEHRAWVKVGRKCEYGETLRCVLAQVGPNTREQMLRREDYDQEDDKKLVERLQERLRGKKCLVVLDDVWEWDTRLMEDVWEFRETDNLPKQKIRILFTSRLGTEEFPCQEVRLLNEEESRKLLSEKVFDKKDFPPHLEKLGKKIAKKCEGLPLMIITVAELLAKEDKTPQYWTWVAQKQQNSVFVNAYDQISKKRGALSLMPMEIWNMQELQRIEVMGRDLPTPSFDATLDKLFCLFGVSAMSCTRQILKRIPNLRSLEIRMEMKPYEDDDDGKQLSGLEHISEELQSLEHMYYRLNYYVVNSKMKYESMVPLSMFPPSLTMLYLCGLGCPWKHMNDIGSLLPNLKALELEHYAFQGPEWDIESKSFLRLERLVIEDTDLVLWRAQHGSLPRLHLLSIRHCYKLQQLDWMRDHTMRRTAIELVECNPLVVDFAKQLRPESLFTVRYHSSF